jgi:hypothetical protein
MMTVSDLKKLDKKINEIQTPFGTGFPVLRGYLKDEALRQGTTEKAILGQYLHWKWSK